MYIIIIIIIIIINRHSISIPPTVIRPGLGTCNRCDRCPERARFPCTYVCIPLSSVCEPLV